MRKMIPSKNLIHIRWKNHNLYRQAKAIIIQHQQTSFTANAKVTFLGSKNIYKKKKKKVYKSLGNFDETYIKK